MNCRGFLSYLLFTLVYIKVIQSMANDGMEVPIWAAFMALLTYVAKKYNLRNSAGALFFGLLGAACIAARIDLAVFVLPFALLALPTWRARLV